ncbi:CMP-N-acetylneuraminate-beta-galactosamide-alpha-2, 3-sialyltransferase [Pasteurellaceae bacterium Macca]|nr:CMP-N-acetylneuraminate-beta-galactosamide-alpha-2, 3-sialyltransferase [Pasteurellaceae bacterium Macca]
MNLMICCTPLQVLIAEKIIEKHPEEQFWGVMLSTVSNAKFDYYTQRLANKCQKIFSMVQHTDRVNLIKEIFKLKKTFRGQQFDKVFVANINDLQIQFLLSTIQFQILNTFDDGTANIVENSLFYQPENLSLNRKIINILLGNKYNLVSLKSLSTHHYTLYEGLPNIIANTTYLNLFESQSLESGIDNQNEEPISILLGQPIYRDEQKNIALAEKVIKQFNIQYYLPHPRETYKIKQVEYIETPLIFEDYLIQQLNGKKCRIYSYFSTAILSIPHQGAIEPIALKVEVNDPAYLACYSLIEKLGIHLIEV